MASGTVQGKPSYVVNLEKAYGVASQAAFGSAVFFDPAGTKPAAEGLERNALEKYEYFCGETWERFGAASWRGAWGQVYSRPSTSRRDIVAELRSIPEISVGASVSMLLDNNEHGSAAHTALADAFDEAHVTELRVFKIGDGEALSGLLIAAQRPAEGALFLVFLMD